MGPEGIDRTDDAVSLRRICSAAYSRQVSRSHEHVEHMRRRQVLQVPRELGHKRPACFSVRRALDDNVACVLDPAATP